MTTYYVSTTGNNSAVGTATNTAWRTINYAVQQVSAGDTVRVLAGEYWENVLIWEDRCNQGSAGSPITLDGP